MLFRTGNFNNFVVLESYISRTCVVFFFFFLGKTHVMFYVITDCESDDRCMT